jgi:MoaA/NifB/PqqE/SkfB family radical SAM enzyme
MTDPDLLDRIRSWVQRGEPAGPYSLHLSPTMACDLDCLFCRGREAVQRHYAAEKDLPDETCIRLVRDALDLGAKVVTLKGGGEPLLRRDLVLELVPLVKSRGGCGFLVTNGTRLDAGLCAALAGSGWDQVLVSLDGPDAATHDGLRGRPGTFERVMEGVRSLNWAKERSGSRFPELAFHCVLTSRNHDRLLEFAELARACRAGRLELDSLSLRREEARSLLLDDGMVSELRRTLPECTELLDRSGISNNLAMFLKEGYVRRQGDGRSLYGSGVPCYYPFYQASVTPAGSIVPCCYAEETHRSSVDLHRTPFREAWFEGDPAEYRKCMLRGEMLPFCAECTAMYADNNARIREAF